MNTEKQSQGTRQIARAAGIVMLAFALSNVTGLVRQIFVSNAFGTGELIDAYNAASRLPDILFNLVAGGALASAFIPTFTEFLERKDKEGAWKLASSIINLVILVLLAVSVLMWVFADQTVSALYAFPPEQQALTVELLRILLITPVIFGVSGLVMGILNAHQSFLLPALAPTMYWLGMILGVIFLVPSAGIYGLAWGAVSGALMHLLIQTPGLLKLKGKFSADLNLQSKAVRTVGRLMGPRVLGAAVVQLNFLVNGAVASGLPEGSLTAIGLGFAIMTMPQVVIAQAIAVAAMPTFSAQAARGEISEMRSSLASTIRGILALSLPAAVGLIILRTPIMGMLFERGAFTAASTELVSAALLWYTVGLVSHSLLEILSRAFYALQDTKTPVSVGIFAMSLNVIFSLTFPGIFSKFGLMPLGGLAFANSLATTIEVIILLYLMRKRLVGIEGKHIWKGAVKSAAAATAMGAALLLIMQTVSASYIIVSLLGIGAGVLVYTLVLAVLRFEEVSLVWNAAARRTKAFFNRAT